MTLSLIMNQKNVCHWYQANLCALSVIMITGTVLSEFEYLQIKRADKAVMTPNCQAGCPYGRYIFFLIKKIGRYMCCVCIQVAFHIQLIISCICPLHIFALLTAAVTILTDWLIFTCWLPAAHWLHLDKDNQLNLFPPLERLAACFLALRSATRGSAREWWVPSRSPLNQELQMKTLWCNRGANYSRRSSAGDYSHQELASRRPRECVFPLGDTGSWLSSCGSGCHLKNHTQACTILHHALYCNMHYT